MVAGNETTRAGRWSHAGRKIIEAEKVAPEVAGETINAASVSASRWQIELFFKWIKQHLRIRRFLATIENAVKTQIWCAISTYVPIAIIKKELQLDASLYTCLQILSVFLFEKSENFVRFTAPLFATPTSSISLTNGFCSTSSRTMLSIKRNFTPPLVG